MIKLCFILAMTILSVFFQHNCEAKSVDEHIYIIPTEGINNDVLESLKKQLTSAFPINTKVIIDKKRQLPEKAYDSSNKKYSAELILNDLSRNFTIDISNENALLVTNEDIYTQDSDHITGYADSKTRMCVASLARLKNEFYGLKPDNESFLDRASKEAIREVAHIWGLPDCPNTRCVMYFSEELPKMDKKTGRLCVKCKAAFNKLRAKPIMKVKVPNLKL